MTVVLLHFALGTLGALAIFLLVTRLSGERSFSAPFGVVFVGVACATLARALSPWATAVVLALYALASGYELWRDRVDRQAGVPHDAP